MCRCSSLVNTYYVCVMYMDTWQCLNVMISGNIFSTRLVKKFWLFKQNERYFTTTRPFLGNLLSHCRKKPFSSTGKKWNKSVKKEWNGAEGGEIKKDFQS